MDSSAKANVFAWRKEKKLVKYIQNIFSRHSSKNRFALVTDNGKPKVEYNFGENFSKLSGVKLGKGAPSTGSAVRVVIDRVVPKLRNGKRVPRIIIFVTPKKILRSLKLDKNVVVLMHLGFKIYHIQVAHKT